MLKYIDYYSKDCEKKKIKDLYYSSFPKNERCPYSLLKSRIKMKRGDFYSIYEEGAFIGLIYNIIYQDIVYIYYFAIEENLRHNGYGSKILTDIKNMYSDKRIILMAETLDPSSNNYLQRVDRNRFYSKNGFIFQGYTVTEVGVRYDMLGGNKNVSKDEFKELVKYYFGTFLYDKVYKNISDLEG